MVRKMIVPLLRKIIAGNVSVAGVLKNDLIHVN